MNQIFIKAEVIKEEDSLALKYSCENGVASSRVRSIPSDSSYVDGAPLLPGEVLMFCEAADGSIIPGFYQYGEPLGDPQRLHGGKGKGHLIDAAQRVVRTFPGQQEAKPEYGTEGRAVVMHWVNGIPQKDWIYNVLDPGINLIPNGETLYFHLEENAAGEWQIPYVSHPAKGNCDDPA